MEEKNIYISDESTVEEDVIIYSNVSIRGKSIIKKGTVIDSNTIITDSEIGEDNYICSSVIESGNIIGNSNKIGPFTHLREENKIGDSNILGSYVEIKNSNIGNNNEIKHLSYIGNADLGNNINVGAGVVFANYHPKKCEKYHAVIEDGVAIGSNSTLILPVNIGQNSLIGAGSVLDKDVDKNSLYINRDMEIYKKNYYGEKKI